MKEVRRSVKDTERLSVPEYEGVYAYKAALEKAKSTKADNVIKALAEVSVDGPRGTIQMNKERHAPLTMYLGQVAGGRKRKGYPSVQECGSGRPVPELEVRS